jgi:integrase/DNA-binding transcriptional regulator YiaG
MSTKIAFDQHNDLVNLQSADITKPFLLETYKQLSERHKEKLRSKGCKEKTLENYDSALAGWLAHKQLTWDSPVGAEFGASFQEELNDHLVHLKKKRRKIKNVTKSGLSRGTIKNRKTALTKLHATSLEQAQHATKPSDFLQTLSKTIVESGLSTRAFAKAAGVDQSKLADWLTGKHRPTGASAVADLRKIELYCQLPENTLLTLAGFSPAGGHSRGNDLPRSKYSVRQQLNVFEKYRMHKYPPRLQQEFQEWYDLMTAPIDPIGPLRRNGHWFVDPETNKCPTGARVRNSLAGLFGYLTLPVEGKEFPIYKIVNKEREVVDHSIVAGMGYDPEILTLALLGDIDLIMSYTEFMRLRSGSYNEETLHIIGLGCSLLLPKTGFVRQHPEYGERLSPQVPPDEWDQWCDRAHLGLKELRVSIKKSPYFEASRDVEEPIEFIINDKHPMRHLFELTARMEAAIPPASVAKKERSVAYRDMFLARLMTANPLRIKQFAEMTWRSDNKGNLYQDRDGNWRLSFPKNAFKNRKTLRKRDRAKRYDAPVAPSLKPYIEEYIFRQRPLLLGADKCDFVFRPGPRGGTFKHKSGDAKPMRPDSLARILWKAARKYLRCMGFGPHAYRHIIATDYIKNEDNGLMVAAAILHDMPETVLKYYGHHQNADFFGRWLDYHERAFEMSKERILKKAA